MSDQNKHVQVDTPNTANNTPNVSEKNMGRRAFLSGLGAAAAVATVTLLKGGGGSGEAAASTAPKPLDTETPKPPKTVPAPTPPNAPVTSPKPIEQGTDVPPIPSSSAVETKLHTEILMPEIGKRFASVKIPKIGLEAGMYGWDGLENSPVLNSTTSTVDGVVEPVLGLAIEDGQIGLNDGKPHVHVAFGHRTHETMPAEQINMLEIGDTMQIELTTPKEGTTDVYDVYDTQMWQMTGKQIVSADAEHAADAYNAIFNHDNEQYPGDGYASDNLLVLYACSNDDGTAGDPTVAPFHPELEGSYLADHRYLTFWQPVPTPVEAA